MVGFGVDEQEPSSSAGAAYSKTIAKWSLKEGDFRRGNRTLMESIQATAVTTAKKARVSSDRLKFKVAPTGAVCTKRCAVVGNKQGAKAARHKLKEKFGKNCVTGDFHKV